MAFVTALSRSRCTVMESPRQLLQLHSAVSRRGQSPLEQSGHLQSAGFLYSADLPINLFLLR